MTLEIFALCDAATVSGGKLNVLGAFDSLFAAQTPVIHPQCTLALRLRFTRIEEGEHRLKLNIVNADGHPVMPSLDGKVAVQFTSDDNSSIANCVINLQQLKLEKFGEYSVDLAVDGRHEASLPLFVKQAPGQNLPA